MGSVFVTQPDRTVKGFMNKEYPVPFYLQFVPGYCVEVVHSDESLRYNGLNTINSIIALPHYSDKVYKTRASAGEEYRYYPLFRTMNDVPSKGDPVLLCTIGKIKYYLGPLNTDKNSPTWNDDPSFRRELILQNNNLGSISPRGVKGESQNFNKTSFFNRLTKKRKQDLDYGTSLFETTGDTIMEGRHGNSLRIGSRSNFPYIFLSNKRNPLNNHETLGDGSIISITSNGTLEQHFEGYEDDVLEQSVFGFTLASDTINPANRFMGELVSNVNGGVNSRQLIYEYNKNQVLIHSDRVTINSKFDDIFMSSVKDIHIGTGRHLTISTNDDLIMESENTFLGNPIINNESREMDSLVLGEQLIEVLKEIVNLFSEIKIMTSSGPMGITSDPTYATRIQPIINQIINKIDNNIKSTKHFIEPNPSPNN